MAACILANVARPFRDEGLEARRVAGVKGATGFFEVGSITSDGRQHPAQGGAYALGALFSRLGLDRVLDEPPERRGDPVRLVLEPGPMPRQERHFTAHDPEARPAGRAGLGARLPLEDLLERALHVEVDLLPRLDLE